MKLRCIADHCPHFKVGRFYDVVEIMEMPGHAMVRKPNGKWPKPGDPDFAWHADEIFAPSPRGIPAYSCGYILQEPEFFGVIVPNSLYPVPRHSARPGSTTQEQDTLNSIVETVAGNNLWWRSCRGVITRCCWPENLESRFTLIGADHANLGRSLSYRRVETLIREVLRRLHIPPRKTLAVDDQQMEFWCRSWRPAGPWTWPGAPASRP